MSFPQLGNIDKRIYDTVIQKASSNLRASQTMPWIRVTSCLDTFLTLESTKNHESFSQKYGNTQKSGRLGISGDVDGNKSIYSDDTGNDRGLRPSPSIDSISISQGNEGLSKKSSFTIICYSLGQAEKIMEYFLEPGNMVLVEWGENNQTSYSQKASINKCAIAAYNNLRHIQQKRTNAHGMYDAVLGVITGGSMGYGSNETFEVGVELTAVGEIPAYLQHHKGIVNPEASIESGQIFQEHELEADDLDVGRALFMQMYNDLPSAKRIGTVKNLGNKGSWATDASNFINMDKEVHDDITKQMSGGAKLNSMNKEDGDPIVIESDVPLFSDKRYIRAALAFTILDSQDNMALNALKIADCDNGASKSQGTIQWYNTICRAHENMFSANSDYLYIPNKSGPFFDVIGALSKKTKLNSVLPDLRSDKGNVASRGVTGGIAGQLKYHLREKGESGDNVTANLHPKTYEPNLDESHYFPNRSALDFDDQACFDNTYGNQVADPMEWGFLRDLYINFDFFCDTIEKNGLVTKDVYYDILNGLSAATNLYWNFQIVVRGHTKIYSPGGPSDLDTFYNWKKENNPGELGQEELQIIDASFGGRMTEAKGVGIAGFQSRGTASPFLSCELNFDIPGAMKGQVTARKLANAPKNANAEDKEVDLDGLFSNKTDTVLEALNSVQKKMTANAIAVAKAEAQEKLDNRSKWEKFKDGVSSATTAVAEAVNLQDTPEEAAEAKAMKSNYEFFANNALVVPRPQDKDEDMDIVDNLGYDGSDTVTLSEIAMVGAWSDANVLKKLQQLNEGTLDVRGGKLAENMGSTSTLNVPLLPIKFNFTIHGVSGIRVGDTFHIVDLPTKYKNKVFQVTNVSHSIEQNLWSTKIEASLRNLKIGSGVLKENSKTGTQAEVSTGG